MAPSPNPDGVKWDFFLWCTCKVWNLLPGQWHSICQLTCSPVNVRQTTVNFRSLRNVVVVWKQLLKPSRHITSKQPFQGCNLEQALEALVPLTERKKNCPCWTMRHLKLSREHLVDLYTGVPNILASRNQDQVAAFCHSSHEQEPIQTHPMGQIIESTPKRPYRPRPIQAQRDPPLWGASPTHFKIKKILRVIEPLESFFTLSAIEDYLIYC